MTNFISISMIALSFLLATFLLLIRKRTSDFHRIKVKSKRNKSKDAKELRTYLFFKKIRLFEYLLIRIEKSINPNSPDSDTIKIISINILKKSLFIVLLSGLLISPFVGNFRILITSLIALSFILLSSIDYFTGKIKTTLLNHLVDFLDILRTKYFETGARVDSALLETIQSLDADKHSIIINEVEKLHEIIDDPDLDLSLRDYYQIAPNSYFKILAALLSITKENGDWVSESGSNFAKSLVDLGSEIKDEITFRNKLNFSLKSLNFIAIVPIFVINPLRIWASRNFFPLEKFYNGSLGFYSELIVLLSVVLAYYGINKIQKFREESEDKDESKIARIIYKRIKPIVDFIKPKKETQRYFKLNRRQKAALDFSTQEIHYTKKLIISTVFAFLTISTMLYSSYINRESILNSPTAPEGYLGGELKGKILEEAISRSALDKEMILKIENGMNSEEIIKDVEKKYGLLGKSKNETVERIIQKFKEYKANEFSVTHIIVVYIIGLMAFYIRDVLLWLKKRIINMDSMTELIKFQLIITLLMHVKNIGVDNLLEWMEMFSFVYKAPLRRAIMDYDSGAKDSLIKLKQCSNDDEFKKLIDHMISAVENVSIKTSFEELENEKKFYELKRKTLYERIVEKKSELGRIVGFIPLYSVILFYFMFPLIYSGISEMETYFKAF